MSGTFPQVPLADVCIIVGGGTPRRSNAAYFDGSIPWATPTDVTALDSLFIDRTKEAITEVGLNESSARLVPVGTVLMTSRATIGYTAIAAQPMATNQGFANLICGDRIAPEYLAYWLRNQREELIQLAGGTTFRELPKSTLKKVHIPLPPINEQRRIVSILNRVAKIERMRARARELMGEFIPALFLKMFSGENPDARHWPVYRVDQMLKDGRRSIRTGPFGSQLRHSEFTDKGVPALGIDNAVTNRFIWAKPRHVAPGKYESFIRYRVFPRDVIITIMGTTGRVCVAPEDLPECMSTKHLCVLTLDRSLVEPYFVWGALLFDDNVRAQTRVHAQGQIMEGWNLSIVKHLQIRVPPLSRQRSFCVVVAQALAMEETISNSAHAASVLSSSLMNRLLRVDE